MPGGRQDESQSSVSTLTGDDNRDRSFGVSPLLGSIQEAAQANAAAETAREVANRQNPLSSVEALGRGAGGGGFQTRGDFSARGIQIGQVKPLGG